MSSTCHGPSQLNVLYLPLQLFTAHDGARYWLRVAISTYPTCLHLMPPLGGSLLEYRYDVWYRMVWLPNGEKFWRYVYSFWQNSQTWWHRSYLHSITQQKFHIPQWWGKWTNDPESVSRIGSPPTVNHFFRLVGTIIHQVSMKSADCFCSNPAHRLTEWLTAPIT